MTTNARPPNEGSHADWLRDQADRQARTAEVQMPAARLRAIADAVERKDARIVELEQMLAVGCDLCGGAHHNNQHDLLERIAALEALVDAWIRLADDLTWVAMPTEFRDLARQSKVPMLRRTREHL